MFQPQHLFVRESIHVRCGSRICVRVGPKRDFADIAQWNRSGGKILGLKIGGRGRGAAPRPPPPLDPHLHVCLFQTQSTAPIVVPTTCMVAINAITTQADFHNHIIMLHIEHDTAHRVQYVEYHFQFPTINPFMILLSHDDKAF